MENTISVRSAGGEKASYLARKIFESRGEFSKEGVSVRRTVWNSIGIEAGLENLYITIAGGVIVGVILLLISKLFENKEDSKDVNIYIKIDNSKVIFKLPEDKQKLLDYHKKLKER